MKNNVMRLIAMLCCVGVLVTVPSCRRKDEDGGRYHHKKEVREKREKPRKKGSHEKKHKKMKTVKSKTMEKSAPNERGSGYSEQRSYSSSERGAY